ncbi:hypothetical protein [Mucilaginibacter sp.]
MSDVLIGRCVFCGKQSTTKDHIPSKCLIEKPYPANLYTVNSCKECNQSFSIDEEYFLNILVEISLNPILLTKKESGSVYRARLRSPKLKNRISNSFVDGTDGRRYIQPEYERINKVIEKNALGLYIKKYNLQMPLKEFRCTGVFPYNIEDMRPADVFMLTYRENFQPKRWTVIQPDVFSFIVVRDWRRGNKLTMIFLIHNTVWCTINIPYPHYRKRRGSNNWNQLKLFDVNR